MASTRVAWDLLLQKRWWLWSDCWWDVHMQKSHTTIWGGWCFCHLWFVKSALFITTKEHPRWLQLRATSTSVCLCFLSLFLSSLHSYSSCSACALMASSSHSSWCPIAKHPVIASAPTSPPTSYTFKVSHHKVISMVPLLTNCTAFTLWVHTRNGFDVRWTGVSFCSLYISWGCTKTSSQQNKEIMRFFMPRQGPELCVGMS